MTTRTATRLLLRRTASSRAPAGSPEPLAGDTLLTDADRRQASLDVALARTSRWQGDAH